MSAKVFLGMPVYGQMPIAAVNSLCWASWALADKLHVHSRSGDSLVTRARNEITADFLASEFERLLFIDSDIVYRPEHIERLIARDLDIVGGVYPIKERGDLKWCARDPEDKPDAQGMALVGGIGTGFLLIHRRVFEKMIQDGIAPAYESDDNGHRTEHDFWQVGVVGRDYLTEDYYFCHLARSLGFKVWADCGIPLQHIGATAWPLPHQQ